MAKDPHLRLRESAAVNDAGVVQLVAQNRIPRLHERGQHADIGMVSRRKDKRRVGAFGCREPVFKLLVQLHRAGDQPGRAGTPGGAAAPRRALRDLTARTSRLADGTVTADSDPETYQPVGTRITRRWVFSERCTEEQCQLWLTREVAGRRPEGAPVRRVRGKLHAVFRKSTPSCSADPGGVTRFFDITVARGDGRLTATENTASTVPGCAPDGQSERSTSTVRWTARRLGA